MKKEAYNQLDPHSKQQMDYINLNNRVIQLQSDLDISEENYKTLLKDNNSLRTEIENLKDRVKYNHNDITGLTMEKIEIQKDIEYLKGKKLVDDKPFWKVW